MTIQHSVNEEVLVKGKITQIVIGENGRIRYHVALKSEEEAGMIIRCFNESEIFDYSKNNFAKGEKDD